MMRRREALRLLAGGTALQLAPSSVLALMREARSVLQDQPSPDKPSPAPRTLNPHQYATVKTVADLMIPRTDTPGATDVGAADFIDLILTEWFEDSERSRFLSGLADVDARSRASFAKDFVDCSAAQQGLALTALGDQMIEERERDRESSWLKVESSTEMPEVSKNFYFVLRQLTLTAYYTSEAGATEELHYEIIPARHAGCAEVDNGGPERQ